MKPYKRLVAMQGCDLALKRLLASLSKGVKIIRALAFQCHGGSYYALTSSHTAFGSRLHSNSSFSVSRNLLIDSAACTSGCGIAVN